MRNALENIHNKKNVWRHTFNSMKVCAMLRKLGFSRTTAKFLSVKYEHLYNMLGLKTISLR